MARCFGYVRSESEYIPIMSREEEDGTEDDEDDFFGNPLKHLMSKVINAKKSGNETGTTMSDIKKKELTKKNKSKKKENTLDDLNDDDDDLLTLGRKRKVKEDSALSKVEQEIKELEIFSSISAFPSSSLSPATSSSTKNDTKRRKKDMDDNNSKSLDSPIIIDDGLLEADDNTFTKEVFIVEPHCSIEIGDLESCDTCIKRWKMNETFMDIIKLYASNWSCSPENVILSLRNGKRISAEDTPRSVAFSEKDVNYLSVYKNSQSGKYKANKITVKWLLPEQNKPIISTVPTDTPFIILKRDFAVDNGLDEEKLTLIFDGERINLQETVSTLGIEDDDCIDVYMM
uniref:Ubiquitin-like domain-containing protein n=1 Tax=Elaeophora elaphi TaxID=1147741 RepID=A0A0R3RGL3_9BILA